MKKFDFIVIGFGKAGKTFAKQAAKRGKKVALIERSPKMYGGSCINIACIPTKVLVEASREGLSFREAILRKRQVVSALNDKNYHNLADDENIEVIDGLGRFKGNKTIEVVRDNVVTDTLTADKIIINTGSRPFIPEVIGIKESRYVHDSTSIMELEKLPERLVIIGGGYISLEFASFFARFGSKVTILEHSDRLMKKEDGEIVEQVMKDFKDSGIEVVLNVDIREITDAEDCSGVITDLGEFEADAILVATGRKPNTESLGLENTDIKVGERGEILVDEYLETSVEGVYAVGDVKGGLQFTYLSLDDSRILTERLFGEKKRSQRNRGNIPYAVFITPVLGRVGLTYDEAIRQGHDAVENKLPVNRIPRHKINNDSRGLFKAVIDRKTDLILGVSLYGENAEELINLVKMAMDYQIPYTALRDAIYTHPTMTESFNDLMDI